MIEFVRPASYPVRGGNQLEALIDGVHAFEGICRAVERARRSVFLTVAFIHSDFTLPGGRGSLFEFLDRAGARGLDIRILFWRPNGEAEIDPDTVFRGDSEQIQWLERMAPRLSIRWDRRPDAYRCHHQKSWIVDAGTEDQAAFVGGMNLNLRSQSLPGHRERDEEIHDVYLGIRGPSAADVHHNFVQRWNEASERLAADGSWGTRAQEPLPMPTSVPGCRGRSRVQIQRTIPRDCYARGDAPPAGEQHAIKNGECSIYDQYLQAIDGAERTIYIENQAVENLEVVRRLGLALERGIRVAILVPAVPERMSRNADAREAHRALAELSAYDRFTMATLNTKDVAGRYRNVYVHSKVMLVDDAFATIGSCNIRTRAFFEHTEMNASAYDEEFVRALRVRLLQEHLDQDTRGLTDQKALELLADLARDRSRSAPNARQGSVVALDPTRYLEDA